VGIDPVEEKEAARLKEAFALAYRRIEKNTGHDSGAFFR
jgi:hypothetical protein